MCVYTQATVPFLECGDGECDRDPGHFFEKFKEIGIAGEAEKFLYLGDGPALCQHRLGEVSPLHGDIMPDGGMGMFLEQAPEIVLV